jgi:hypothetical protein
MKQPYQPRELVMTILTTPNEVIALGHLITTYLSQSARIPQKTREHLELIELLERFQQRLASQAQQPIAPSYSSMEVRV